MRTLTKLQSKDYLDLYGLFVPEEIKEEFGTRSLSAKAIQNLYNDYYALSSKDAQKALIENSLCIADISLKAVEHYTWVCGNVAKERESRKQRVWERLHKVDSIYQ